VIGEDGQLRRDYLRKLIFDDPLARQKLESIIHPLVFDEIARRLSLVIFPYCIVSSPLLLESKSKHEIDRVLVIDAPENMQIERATQRDDSRQDEIRKIIDSQSSRQNRLAAADDVIVNDRDLSHLREQIEALHDKYLKVATTRLVSCS
jgi:dephospho-CoA kinase